MFLGTLLIHWPAHQAGFVADFLGWEKQYREMSFWAFLSTFGHPVHQQLPQFFNIFLYKCFGTWGLPWYLLFCLAHAVNGFLLYRFLLLLGKIWQLSSSVWIAVAGALFFLFSPYVTDATVWKVCFHYLLSGAFTLGSLLGIANYLQTGNKQPLWLAHLLLLLHFFTLEMALAVPMLTHAVCIAWWLTAPTTSINGSVFRVKNLLRYITLPQLSISALFFLVNKISFGQWVGHYGEATHLRFDAMRMLGQPMKYLAKYASFGRHFEHKDKARLFAFFETPTGLYLSYGVVIALLCWVLLYKKRQQPRLALGVLMFCLGLLATFPVSNLHFEWVLFNELDRYGYLASLFFLSGMAIFFSALPGWWKNLPAGIYLAISIYFLSRICCWWGEMEYSYQKLLRDYKWLDKKEVYVLASADNYQGIWSWRSYREKPTLHYALELMHNRPIDSKIYEIAQFNLNSLKEGISISVPDTSNGVIRVEFDQWGNWWWRRGKGADNYQNDLYKVEFKGKWYELTLKNRPQDAVFICQSGDGWKVLGE
jgi:hypothetical protein